MTGQRVLIYLLRRDLRIADNPIFHEISKISQQSQKPFTHVLPLYVFPAQQIEISGFLSSSEAKSPLPEARSEVGKFWRCGPHRAKFLAESVWDLKTELEKLGSKLLIQVGMTGQVLQDVLDQFKDHKGDATVTHIWMTEEEGVEEKREEREIRKVAQAAGIDFRLWTDEKYLIDEYVSMLHAQKMALTFSTAEIYLKKDPATFLTSSHPTANPSSHSETVLEKHSPTPNRYCHHHPSSRHNQSHSRYQTPTTPSSRPYSSHSKTNHLLPSPHCFHQMSNQHTPSPAALPPATNASTPSSTPLP